MARGATQTQGSQGRRRRDASPEEEESDGEFDAGAQTQGGTGGLKESELESKAADLVRLMLSNEYKKRPVPRAMITSDVMGKQTRGFNAVFEIAQKRLRSTFGMEMVQLRARRVGAKAMETQTVGESSTQAAAKAKQGGGKAYILRNLLPAPIVAAMAHPRPLRHHQYGDDEWQEDSDVPDSGSLLRLEKSDGTQSGHVAMLGIRTVILSLVMCSGRVIMDDHLHALLKRLNLHRDTVLPYASIDAIEGEMTLDKYLELLAKQNYLEKTKIIGQNGPDTDGGNIEWRWGSREVEFSEQAAAAFIESIFTSHDDSDSEDEDAERRRRGPPRDKAAERKAKKAKLRGDIAKAAGGELQGEL